MEVAAIHGTGTFDHTMRKWKIRTRELTASASIRQLSNMFKTEVPNTERESRPYWLRYLEELRKAKTVTQAETELEAAKKRYANDAPPEYSPFERDTATGEVRRKTPLNFDQIRILNAATQIQNPDTEPAVREFLLERLTPKPAAAESLKAEIASAIQRAKARNPKGKGWFSIRQFLEMFGDITGDISFRNITVKHYREYWEKVKAEKWSDRNRANAMQTLNTFLKRLEADHDLRFTFRQNPEYRITAGEGQKTQYTVEQVKTALQNATDIARTALLLGLNCGFYWGDLTSLKPQHIIDGGYLKKGRKKNEKKPVQVVGTWKLWPETIEAIQYGLTKWQLEEAYRQFREAHDLPEHKALRKTVAQMIQDDIGETEARLYRCEGVGGTHGRSYIKNFTPPQVAKLEAALLHVRAKLLA